MTTRMNRLAAKAKPDALWSQPLLRGSAAQKMGAALGLALLLGAGCAVYPDLRDTTQPDKIKKAMLVCDSSEAEWEECRRNVPSEWYFRATVIDAPYEAWWTFVGEQGSTYRISWEITEKLLIARRTYETVKGGAGVRVNEPGWLGEPVAAFSITSHFDVWHQYNSTTGEQLPVLYESQERPWYEREYIRVDWSKNQIAGYGDFMGSKLTAIFGDVKVEPTTYAVNDPAHPDYRILSDDYLDIVTRETHTPWTVSGMDGSYFWQNPVSQISFRNSFMRVDKRDYQPMYYPDQAFEKFGYFRNEREYYDRERGMVDFKDYLLNRHNIWGKTHSKATCTQHSDCGGAAEDGVTCDLLTETSSGKGLCTLPYKERGLKAVNFYLSPDFPEELLESSCMVAQGWNVALKQAVAPSLKVNYSAPELNEAFARKCKIENFKAAKPDEKFDINKHDLFVLTKNEKTCDADGKKGKGDRWCYRIGDLRYSMLAYVYQASSGSPLGYGPSASDPVTGEIIQANSFIYGAAIDSYRSFIADVYDLVVGNLTEDEIRTGESVREYYEQLSGNTFPATIPQQGYVASSQFQLRELQERLQSFKDDADNLKRLSPAARTPNRLAFKDSWVERMLFDNEEWRLSNGVPLGHELSEDELNVLSPLRSGFHEEVRRQQQVEDLWSRSQNCVYQGNEYSDATVSWLAADLANKGYDREGAINKVVEMVYRGVTEHEIGHNMGLRHNFEGSFDRENFFPEYFEILKDPDLAEPDPLSFSTQSPKALPLSPEEYRAYDAARNAVRLKRDAAGLKMYQYSSIMDYGGQFYSDFRGLGKYDFAAIKFGYGNTVEVFDGAPDEDRLNRVNRSYYLGGESCVEDSDCPFARSGQVCLPPSASGRQQCSSSDNDLAADGANHPPVHYRFCSDERAADRPFCSRWDEGASSVEIVENLIDSYDRNYIFNNFRRYRRYFGPSYQGRIFNRYFLTMGKQFASLLYQLYYNQSAMLTSGPGSFNDMLAASVKTMNFFERVLSTPDVGAYRKIELEEVNGEQRYLYERYHQDCKDSRADLSACLGVGKHFYSVWEDGYFGAVDRQARMGVFTDKILAVLALTNREWGNPQANDESYPLSFYDGFRDDMLDLFSGLISGNLRGYAPVVKVNPQDNSPRIEYRDRWSGRFFGVDANQFSYNSAPVVEYPADPQARYASEDLISPDRGSAWIRFYALVFSLQSWPSIYDQTFVDYLQLYTFGAPEVRFPADGVETVAYESPLRKKTFMAVQTPDKKSIIFPLVKQAAELKAEYDYYVGMTPQEAVHERVREKNPRRCDGSRTPDDESCRQYMVEYLDGELRDSESFLNLTDQLMQLVGLSL